MNQLERNVTEAIKDAAASGTRAVMMGKFTAETLLREYRTARDDRRRFQNVAVFLFISCVCLIVALGWAGYAHTQAMRKFSVPRMQPGPATELGTTDVSEPNMMTVSIVHRFRHQNKG